MTNTVIFMTLGDLRIATQRLFRLAPFTYEYEYWLFTTSNFHVGGGRNIRRGKTQMSAFSSYICVYM
jgi:hypothetical protein